jgi:hypothetical protein
MSYTIPARTTKTGKAVPEIIVDDEFKDLVDGVSVSLTNMGYPQASFGGKASSLHRYLWKLKYGTNPKEIDHINGNPLDSRIENLRPASRSLNRMNIRKKGGNSKNDLPLGVYYDPTRKGRGGKVYPRHKPYKVQIGCGGGRYKHLGNFATPEEASAVYQAMKFMLMLVESALCL